MNKSDNTKDNLKDIKATSFANQYNNLKPSRDIFISTVIPKDCVNSYTIQFCLEIFMQMEVLLQQAGTTLEPSELYDMMAEKGIFSYLCQFYTTLQGHDSFSIAIDCLKKLDIINIIGDDE